MKGEKMPENIQKANFEIPNYYTNRVDLTASNTDVCCTFGLNVPRIGKSEKGPENTIVPQARMYMSIAHFLQVRDLFNRVAEQIEKQTKNK